MGRRNIDAAMTFFVRCSGGSVMKTSNSCKESVVRPPSEEIFLINSRLWRSLKPLESNTRTLAFSSFPSLDGFSRPSPFAVFFDAFPSLDGFSLPSPRAVVFDVAGASFALAFPVVPPVVLFAFARLTVVRFPSNSTFSLLTRRSPRSTSSPPSRASLRRFVARLRDRDPRSPSPLPPSFDSSLSLALTRSPARARARSCVANASSALALALAFATPYALHASREPLASSNAPEASALDDELDGNCSNVRACARSGDDRSHSREHASVMGRSRVGKSARSRGETHEHMVTVVVTVDILEAFARAKETAREATRHIARVSATRERI